MIDRDEAGGWRDDLPRRFSELKESPFPLFISLDKASDVFSLSEHVFIVASSKVVCPARGRYKDKERQEGRHRPQRQPRPEPVRTFGRVNIC